MRIRKYRILNQNVKVMKHDLSRTVHLATKGDFLYYFTGNLKKTFCVPIVRNIFLLILTVIITERFNLHFSRITLLVAARSFLLSSMPNFTKAPLLYCWYRVKRFLPVTLFHNFQNIFRTLDRKQRKFILTRFNLENILSSLVLETGTMNNNLIISSTLLESLIVGAAKVLRHWLDTKLWLEKESSLHILLIRTSVSKNRK